MTVLKRIAYQQVETAPVICTIPFGEALTEGIIVKLCLTIGVSRSTPLTPLPGAITVAHEFANWAQQSGFTTELITDEANKPVTISRVRKTLLAMLPQNDEVELLILHFAGHGFRTGAEQNVWLPSDWYQEMRGISVERLRRQLYRHGIKSLSIFSDACRSLPPDIETADIAEDPVLPRGPYDAVPPVLDRFSAVMDGEKAFMLKGDQRSPARCIFSTVILEGLCGHRDEAFDKYLPDCVIPESLGLFSQARMREIGERYRLKCSPDVLTGIPREHAVYFQRGKSPNGNIPPPQWPAPPEDPAQDKLIAEWKTKLPEDFDPSATSENWESAKKQRYVRNRFSVGRAFLDDGTNLVVLGQTPKRIWATATARRNGGSGRPSEYRVNVEDAAVQVLVEFRDGVVASAVVYRELITVLSRDKRGLIGWTCVNRWIEVQPQIEDSIDVIANLQLGKLAADQVDQLAAGLREMKHVNPVVGAISSYLYDYGGDIDSIRRMAYFYCHYDQAIPFDIAFMGLLPIQRTRSGYRADVPAVVARRHSAHNDGLPNWVTRATPARSGDIAGFWPWLRQGWQFVDDPEAEEEAAADSLRDVIPFLLPSQFSSFQKEGAEILIRKFHMEGNI
ncbi:caspase family protein [Agrobacterium larrymoorei]|uniref:caspase family protein n=1 Tax=Agrobacterium larrymoorei TaxID=160699 RepID=UPI001F34FA62|nr:caspase family protein [Agrobacterium larrymoorei]